MATVHPRGPRSDRREALLSDIRRVALDHVSRRGVSALSLSAVARDLGMSSPALYHYFASRDDLLAAIVLESHQHLTAWQEAATERATGRSPEDRFRIVVDASRDWCLENSSRYRLLFDLAPAALQSRADEIVAVSRRGLAQVLAAVAALDPADPGPADAALAAQVARAFSPDEPLLAGVTPGVILVGFRVHTRLIGIANLEVAGVFADSGIDLGRLWHDEVERILAELTGGG